MARVKNAVTYMRTHRSHLAEEDAASTPSATVENPRKIDVSRVLSDMDDERNVSS
jgi:hypothetical protein